MLVMDEEVGVKLGLIAGCTLSNLVLMMRKDEIDPAGVDIERLS